MNTRHLAILIAATLAVGLGAYSITRAARSASSEPAVDPAAEALLEWLNVPADQRKIILDHDPSFGADLKKLRQALAAARAELAASLEKTDTPASAINQHVEATIAARAALERRTAQHLLAVRDHLSPQQRQQLFGVLAEECRGQGRQMRMRMGYGPGGGQGRGPR